MTEFKGTKGKWTVYNYQGKGGVIDILPKNEDINTSQQIAQVFNRLEVGVSSSGLSENSTQLEADALLISKAPEMLELLIEVSRHHQGGHSEIGHKIKLLIEEATELKE